MKKFIRIKIDNTDSSNPSPSSTNLDTLSPLNIEEREENNDVIFSESTDINNDNNNETVMGVSDHLHPPLPLEPPPIDVINDMALTLKMEFEEHENRETSNSIDRTDIVNQSENSDDNYAISHSPVCRDFIRGSCTRTGTCKYQHRYNLSNLVGVYTFCRNYQNSKCSLPNCKYVHASVFQEQNFYRTGILPPEALSHHKKGNNVHNNVQPTESNAIPVMFTQPPPTVNLNALPITGSSRCSINPPSINMESTITTSSSPSSFSTTGSPQTRDFVEHIKCPQCDIMEFRLLYHKRRIQQMTNNIETVKTKYDVLGAKQKKLYSVLLAILKANASKNMPEETLITTEMPSEPYNNGKQDQIVDQLVRYWKSNSIRPIGSELKKFPVT